VPRVLLSRPARAVAVEEEPRELALIENAAQMLAEARDLR
jgi:hypothetical protein